MAAGCRALAALLLSLALAACATQQVQTGEPGLAASFTDGRFEVRWQTAQTKQGRPLVVGTVRNTRGGGVANIRVQVETLDAQGQVIGRATALAPGYLGGFATTSFEVPLEKTGPGYLVSVLSWDPAGNGQ